MPGWAREGPGWAREGPVWAQEGPGWAGKALGQGPWLRAVRWVTFSRPNPNPSGIFKTQTKTQPRPGGVSWQNAGSQNFFVNSSFRQFVKNDDLTIFWENMSKRQNWQNKVKIDEFSLFFSPKTVISKNEIDKNTCFLIKLPCFCQLTKNAKKMVFQTTQKWRILCIEQQNYRDTYQSMLILGAESK